MQRKTTGQTWSCVAPTGLILIICANHRANALGYTCATPFGGLELASWLSSHQPLVTITRFQIASARYGVLYSPLRADRARNLGREVAAPTDGAGYGREIGQDYYFTAPPLGCP